LDDSIDFSNSIYLKSLPCENINSNYLIAVSENKTSIGVWKISFNIESKKFESEFIFQKDLDEKISLSCIDCSLNISTSSTIMSKNSFLKN
jgi:hypothetical protein